MTDEDLEKLLNLINSAFDAHIRQHELRELSNFEERAKEIMKQYVAVHETGEHHAFVALEMAREKRRQEIWTKVQGSMIFWLLVSATSAIGWAVWETFFHTNK